MNANANDDLYQDLTEPVKARVTWASRVDEYVKMLKARSLAPRTLQLTSIELIPFAVHIGHRDMNGALVLTYIQERFAELGSPYSRRLVACFISRFLTWAEAMGYLAVPLARLVPHVPTPGRTTPVIFTEAQYETVKAAARGTNWHYPLVCAYRTGARLSDVCLMRWGNIDLDELLVRYIPWKSRRTKREAVCPFTPGCDLHELLLELHQSRRSKSDEAFIDAALAVRYKEVQRRISMDFKAFCLKHGVGGLSFHKLRNSFMSRVVASGVPFSQATQMTGLASESVFHDYAKPDLSVLRNAIHKMDAPAPPDAKTVIVPMQ